MVFVKESLSRNPYMPQAAISAPNRLSLPRRGSTQRTSPLVEVSREFAAKSRPDRDEVTRFRDMFYVMILKTGHSDRLKVAEILSRSPYTPRAVAIYFSMEEIDISAPVLLFSPVLTSYDLNRIIEKKQIQHASAIARRNDLDVSTLHCLLKADNEEKKLARLLRRNSSVANNDQLLAILDQTVMPESNEPENIATNASVPAENATQAETLSPVAIQEPMPSTPPARDLTHELVGLARLDRKRQSAPEAGTVSFEGSLATQMLTRARAIDLDGLAAVIHREAGLPRDQTLSILTEDNAGMQASLFRALGLSKVNASKMLLLLNRSIGRNAQVFRLVMQKYDRLSEPECRKFFEQMGASFENSRSGQSSPVQHAGHFSAAIAERRRNLTRAAQEFRRNSAFGKRNVA